MSNLIDKSALVAEIERRIKSLHQVNSPREQAVLYECKDIISFINTLEVVYPYKQHIQYPSVKDGIKAHAETYSFNIESELFNQLTKEQQALWRKEIEQACISGGEAGVELARDPRYKENLEVKEVQKEPVSIDFEQELYKAFGQVKDFTLCMRIAKRFYDMGKNSQEHVSEDLEQASKEWLKPQLDKSYADYGETNMMELTHFDGYAMLDAIEFGAKWQKKRESIQSKDLEELINELSKQFPEVSFAKLSRIAVRVAKWQMAQMIKDATDVTVHVDAGGYPYIPQMELYDYDKDIPLAKEGDKYKVVLIKED